MEIKIENKKDLRDFKKLVLRILAEQKRQAKADVQAYAERLIAQANAVAAARLELLDGVTLN